MKTIISAISYISSIILKAKLIPISFCLIFFNIASKSPIRFHITAYLDIVHYFDNYFNFLTKLFTLSYLIESYFLDRINVLINFAI